MVVSSRTTQFISFCFFKRAYRICCCGIRIDTWRTFGNNSMFFFFSSHSNEILVFKKEIWKLLWKTVSFGMGVFIVRPRPWGEYYSQSFRRWFLYIFGPAQAKTFSGRKRWIYPGSGLPNDFVPRLPHHSPPKRIRTTPDIRFVRALRNPGACPNYSKQFPVNSEIMVRY